MSQFYIERMDVGTRYYRARPVLQDKSVIAKIKNWNKKMSSCVISECDAARFALKNNFGKRKKHTNDFSFVPTVRLLTH